MVIAEVVVEAAGVVAQSELMRECSIGAHQSHVFWGAVVCCGCELESCWRLMVAWNGEELLSKMALLRDKITKIVVHK